MSTTLRPPADRPATPAPPAPADYAAIYDPDTDFDRHYTAATADLIAGRLGPHDRVLELGCATGAMTARLAGERRTVVAVDRAPAYLRRAHARGLRGVTWIRGDLEDPLPDALGRFDHVVVANVLHELDEPAALLRRIVRDHLARGGTVHVSLQNPRSLHRIVALEMGLIDTLDEVAAAGRRYATRRLYDADAVATLAATAGLTVVRREGVMLKPLPNAAMAALPADVLAGFVAAARHLPDHAAMGLYALRVEAIATRTATALSSAAPSRGASPTTAAPATATPTTPPAATGRP